MSERTPVDRWRWMQEAHHDNGRAGAVIAMTELKIRRANSRDTLTLWRLANDPMVRMSSFSPDFIPLDDHTAWLKSKLVSSECCIWILELGGEIAAQIRYDRVDGTVAEIDFSVAPEFRGRGLGTKALTLTCGVASEELGASRVRAADHNQNITPARAFLTPGIAEVKKCWENDQYCTIFERDCSFNA